MFGKIGLPATRDNVQSQEPGVDRRGTPFRPVVALGAREAGRAAPLPRDAAHARIDTALRTSLSFRRLKQWLYLAELSKRTSTRLGICDMADVDEICFTSRGSATIRSG
jgi:hypothetical protein